MSVKGIRIFTGEPWNMIVCYIKDIYGKHGTMKSYLGGCKIGKV